MIYLNFLLSKSQKSKAFETLSTIGLALIIIYIIINVVLFVAPIFSDFLAQSVELSKNLISGNLSTTDVFGGNVFTLIIILTMPISIVIFLELMGIGGFRGDYGIL